MTACLFDLKSFDENILLMFLISYSSENKTHTVFAPQGNTEL